jgi:hypothetical protein
MTAMIRRARRIPPCIWVVNQHTEEITVVVSKYRPNRILTGIGVSAAPTGAGLSFSTAVWSGRSQSFSSSPQTFELIDSLALAARRT